MEDYNTIKTIADLGGSAAIAIVLILCIYKLLARFGAAFVAAHQNIAVSVASQAQCISDMRDGIDSFIRKDNGEHQQILLGMQVVGSELKDLVSEIRDMRKKETTR